MYNVRHFSISCITTTGLLTSIIASFLPTPRMKNQRLSFLIIQHPTIVCPPHNSNNIQKTCRYFSGCHKVLSSRKQTKTPQMDIYHLQHSLIVQVQIQVLFF